MKLLHRALSPAEMSSIAGAMTSTFVATQSLARSVLAGSIVLFFDLLFRG
jgi:hypothetical protein